LLDRSPSSLRLGANRGVWFDLCLVSPSQDARTQGPLHMLVLAATGRTTGQRVALVPAADDAMSPSDDDGIGLRCCLPRDNRNPFTWRSGACWL